MQSIAILGRQPALGIAELESLYGASAVSVVAEQIAGLNLPVADINFTRIGGSTRLAEVITEVPSKLWKDVEKALAKAIPELAGTLPEGKLQLGFSAYGIPITPAKLNASALTLKKIVRGKTDRSVRITPNPELELNTAQVLHNHLTGPTGIEMLIIATDDGKTLLARTTAVQDIDSYTLRDRGRPKRDARVGMLPPKLAQILINLAAGKNSGLSGQGSANSAQGPEPSALILDPFCGTGVLLQEALLMGYVAHGTDLEQRMIDYSQANLDWLVSKFELRNSKFSLAQADATTFRWDTQGSVVSSQGSVSSSLAIATETYLGRPFTERPPRELIEQTASEVNLILKKFLQNIQPQLQPGTPLCLAVPAWALGSGRFKHLPLIDQLDDLGFIRIEFKHLLNDQLLYFRDDQIVARQLLVLTRA